MSTEAANAPLSLPLVRTCGAAGGWRAVAAQLVVALVAAVIASIAVPTIASAGTVRTPSNQLGLIAIVDYQAAPGEHNDVRVRRPLLEGPDVVIVFDAAAPVVVASPLCASLDAHTARCSIGAPVVRVELGDMNDTLTSDLVALAADGGAGDDVLDASGAFEALLDGGGGRDHIVGTALDDLITDGDRDDTAGPAAPGPDVIDGGLGVDHLTYRQRTEPVSVDLADDRPDGAAGEGDTLGGIEGVTGGSGDDRLVGDERDNALDGRRGHDVLIGRGGDDVFGYNIGGPLCCAGPVPWSPALELGGFIHPDDPTPRIPASGDAVGCGTGEDMIFGRRSTDLVRPACERVIALRRLPFKEIGSHLHYTALDAYPTQHRGSLTYPVFCSDIEDWEHRTWRRLRCSGTVELHEAAGQQKLLATGALSGGPATVTARLKLTATGRRLANRPRGLKATLRIRGKNVPNVAWTIRFRAH